MIRLPRDETKAMVAVHGWSGILLGLLLYAVVLTGTAAVFAEEIGAWSAGHVATRSAFERPMADSLRRLGAKTPDRYSEAVDLFETGDHDLGVFFHRHEMDRGELISRGIFYVVGDDGRVIHRQAGTNEDVYGARNDNALSSFLVDTHVRLHVPNPWGLLLTGILGLSMLVAAVSGLLIHRHLFKDIFTLRRSGSAVLANRDAHSVAGTWSLPFAFVLAFTGSFFSFFGTVGMPVVAMAAFGGDVQALTEAVYGTPGKPDPRPAAMGNMDRINADAIARAGAVPTFVTIENFGRADAKVTTYHPPRDAAIAPMSLLYDGATAAFLQEKPLIGPRPSTGGTLAAIMSPLHFGNFAGLLSKAIWFGLGFAMCYVTYTGIRLWLVRREGGVRSFAWLERTNVVVGLGLPFALAASTAVFLVAMPLGSATWWTPAGFLIGTALAIMAGAIAPNAERLSAWLRGATGAMLLLLPLLRLLTGGPGWSTAFVAGQPIIVTLDIAFLFAGGWTLWQLRRNTDRPRPSIALQPAE
ncbi:putative iron-regulated membrane protein [Sphingobium sp. OAS761]|uniref:PepSY-associated TM helix domain-containing protein n=1 Tax=Sphingobium sp. OAS761 TaxID=2817901 RepID=UPI00209DBC00|nr:PepSY-associated TM helix domain-containing protein [Sphingobium sp. OAS761]MCP1469429.1 putative iron-regulated membrane protein [Sphingobium sp. OAS761]